QSIGSGERTQPAQEQFRFDGVARILGGGRPHRVFGRAASSGEAPECGAQRCALPLSKALAREKELSQLKSNFVSMVSHEFRTPLGIIQSSAELLRDFYQRMQADERDEQLESIARNTRRMAGMMEEILVLSRLDAGKLEFQAAALDLNAVCRRVVA